MLWATGYLLSKKEQRAGSPEKPLSGLGALGYKNYWTLALMRYLDTAPDRPSLEGGYIIRFSLCVFVAHVKLRHQRCDLDDDRRYPHHSHATGYDIIT